MEIKGRKLFKLFDFEVKVDPSWLIIAILITWSLAVGFFPYFYEGLPASTYWMMGIAGAILLFGSVIAHELTHSLVARRFGLPMKGITLFIFGGVAEMSDEPPSSKAEFFMAFSGPLSSIAIGFIFHFLLIAGRNVLPVPVEGVVSYLRWINWVLAAFNLVPAFPLDGGRMLRSILWARKKDLRWATKISSRIGAGFGLFLSLVGVFYFIAGAFIGGLWWLLIGMFIRNASKMSYQQVLIRQSLSGELVTKFMNTAPVTVPPDITVQQLVDDYIYKHHYKMFPVTSNGTLKGCVSTREVQELSSKDWGKHTVSEYADRCSIENTVGPETEASKVLVTMEQSNKSRLMVVENGKLLGIIALKDMLSYISLKSDLEGG